MSIMPVDEISTTDNTSRGKEFNEFAKIEGLGPAMQRWLRETFHVYTVADLASLSVNRVMSRLEDEEKAFCRREIEHWIQQAQAFAARQSSWRTFATFVVSLQSRQMGSQTDQRTTAYFLEADRRMIWSGVEYNGVYELMLDQLKHVLQLKPEEDAPMESTPNIESGVLDNRPLETTPIAVVAETGPKNIQNPRFENQGYEPEKTPVSVSSLVTGNEPEEIQPDSVTQLDIVAETLSKSESVTEALEVGVETSESELNSAIGVELPVSEAYQTLSQAAVVESEAKLEQLSSLSVPLVMEIIQLKFWQSPWIEKSEAEEPGEKEFEKEELEDERNEMEPTGFEKAIAVNMTKRSLIGMLHKAEPFQIEVTFQLSGKKAIDSNQKPLSYYIQCFVKNREDRERVRVENSSTGTFTNGKFICTKRLPKITLLKPGLYCLQIITRLEGGHASPGFFELPLVQVF